MPDHQQPVVAYKKVQDTYKWSRQRLHRRRRKLCPEHIRTTSHQYYHHHNAVGPGAGLGAGMGPGPTFEPKPETGASEEAMDDLYDYPETLPGLRPRLWEPQAM